MLMAFKMEEGPSAKEGKWPPEDGKGKEIDSPLEPPGTNAAVSLLTSRTLLQESECVCFEAAEIVVICHNSHSKLILQQMLTFVYIRTILCTCTAWLFFTNNSTLLVNFSQAPAFPQIECIKTSKAEAMLSITSSGLTS